MIVSSSKSEVKVLNDSKRYLKLTPYSEILTRIGSCFASHVPKVESIPLDLAHGQVSAEDVVSRVDIPARTVAAMDGYAVRFVDLRSSSTARPASFNVRGSIYPDNSSELPSIRSAETFYVATGAPLPKGADTVLKVEEVLQHGGEKFVVRHTIPRGKNVALKGEDVHKGQVVVRKGQVLSPIDVALLIGVGKKRIKAYKSPTVGLLSIGNELREFDSTLEIRPHRNGQVVNNYLNLLSGYVEIFGSKVVSLGTCGDDPRGIQSAVSSGFNGNKYDVIFTISGSSVGRHDNVIDALEAVRGSKTLFHGVRVVPIRPSGIVMVHNKPVVMIPGHAVSALLAFFVIGLPVLNMLSGLDPLSRRAVIDVEAKSDITNERAIEALSLVKLEADSPGGRQNYRAVPLSWGSNLLSNLSEADGFVWLAPHQVITKDQQVSVRLFTGSPIAKSDWSSTLI